MQIRLPKAWVVSNLSSNWGWGCCQPPWVPRPLPPHPCADTLLPAERNQSARRSHCNCDLHWQLMLYCKSTQLSGTGWMTGNRFPMRKHNKQGVLCGSYLPTVWLASCLIRLNCFFILCFSALPPGGAATPHISLIDGSRFPALIPRQTTSFSL